MFGPSEGALSGSGWVSMKTPATPTATAARASTGTNSRCAAAGGALAARLLDGMGGVEDHRRADLGHDRQAAHVGDAACCSRRRRHARSRITLSLPLSVTLAATLTMSQGARNWPFLTLTTRPVLRSRDEQVRLAAEEGRDLQHVDDLGDRGALARRHARPSGRACRCAPGFRRRPAARPQAPCHVGPSTLVRLALSKEVLKTSPMSRAVAISLSASAQLERMVAAFHLAGSCDQGERQRVSKAHRTGEIRPDGDDGLGGHGGFLVQMSRLMSGPARTGQAAERQGAAMHVPSGRPAPAIKLHALPSKSWCAGCERAGGAGARSVNSRAKHYLGWERRNGWFGFQW